MKKCKKEHMSLFDVILWGTGLVFWIYQLSCLMYLAGEYFHLEGLFAAMGGR